MCVSSNGEKDMPRHGKKLGVDMFLFAPCTWAGGHWTQRGGRRLSRRSQDGSRAGLSEPEIREPRSETRDPRPETRYPSLDTRYPKPKTRDPKPEARSSTRSSARPPKWRPKGRMATTRDSRPPTETITFFQYFVVIFTIFRFVLVLNGSITHDVSATDCIRGRDEGIAPGVSDPSAEVK